MPSESCRNALIVASGYTSLWVVLLLRGVDKFFHKAAGLIDDKARLCLNYLKALDPAKTIWCYPTVTMRERAAVVLRDDRRSGEVYPAVTRILVWLQGQNRIKADFTVADEDTNDMLAHTHPGAPLVYPKRTEEGSD